MANKPNELSGLDLKQFGEFSELYTSSNQGGSSKNKSKNKVVNPFGAVSSEFNIAPLGSGASANPFDRVKTGLPEYDAVLNSMYPPTPTPQTQPPAPVPLRSRPISGFSPEIQSYLSSVWSKIGKGAAMPSTLGDFLSANLAAQGSRRTRGARVGGNPFGPGGSH